MASDRILALMALMDDIKRPHDAYWRAVSRAVETYTDSPENNAAQARGSAALLEIEDAVRQWVAKHPEPLPLPTCGAVHPESTAQFTITPCRRSPGHLGSHRDAKQKGTETYNWEAQR